MRSFLLAFFISVSLLSQAQAPKELASQLDSLVSNLQLKNAEFFARNSVYRGEDDKRKWKDVNDPSNPVELRQAKLMMTQLQNALQSCNPSKYDDYTERKESEGKWYVLTLACENSKKIYLAFLKLNGRYALGDIDVEEDQ